MQEEEPNCSGLDAIRMRCWTRALSQFQQWCLSCVESLRHVRIQRNQGTGGVNAVVSGVFFGGASSGGGTKATASLSARTATQGNWHGVYGADGYSVANDSQSSQAMLPWPLKISLTTLGLQAPLILELCKPGTEWGLPSVR